MNSGYNVSHEPNEWNGGLREMIPEEKTLEEQQAAYNEQVLKLTSNGYSTRQAKRLIAKAVRKEMKGMR